MTIPTPGEPHDPTDDDDAVTRDAFPLAHLGRRRPGIHRQLSSGPIIAGRIATNTKQPLMASYDYFNQALKNKYRLIREDRDDLSAIDDYIMAPTPFGPVPFLFQKTNAIEFQKAEKEFKEIQSGNEIYQFPDEGGASKEHVHGERQTGDPTHSTRVTRPRLGLTPPGEVKPPEPTDRPALTNSQGPSEKTPKTGGGVVPPTPPLPPPGPSPTRTANRKALDDAFETRQQRLRKNAEDPKKNAEDQQNRDRNGPPSVQITAEAVALPSMAPYDYFHQALKNKYRFIREEIVNARNKGSMSKEEISSRDRLAKRVKARAIKGKDTALNARYRLATYITLKNRTEGSARKRKN